jgi:SPP1 family phage portal protein
VWQYSKNGFKKEIFKVEYHTTAGVWYYILGEKGLKPDPDRGNRLEGHFVVTVPQTNEAGETVVDEKGNELTEDVQATWDKVPFVGFKYNADEISLLKWIKPLVDDYDLNTSDTSNTLQDVPNSIKVVKNYDGQDKGEFVQNLATYRTAFVSGDGDMHSLETKLDTAAIDSHLNRLKDDIYEAGNGVDNQDENLGNASGVALAFRYAGLNMDMTDMGNEFEAALEELIWFIKVDMLNKGLGDFMETEFDIVFNTDMIINETEAVNNAKNSVGIISDETAMSNHPWVTDLEEEKKRLKKQKEEALAEAEEMMATGIAFGQAANGPIDEEGDEGGEF